MTPSDNGTDRRDGGPLIVTNGSSSPEGAVGAVRRALNPSRTAVTSSQYEKALQQERSEHAEEGLSLYVHIPFCPSRCLTCDHETTVTHDSREIDRYIDGIEKEATLVTSNLGRRRELQQLHLGGGTPNYLSETQLVRLISVIEQHFEITPNTEASLDANAHRASYAQLSLLHGLGLRGINLEIRDLDSDVLQAVGRSQSLGVIRDVVDSAREIGFDRVSTDLVYGLPRQSAQSIQRSVEQLLSLQPDRISCFAHSRRQDAYEHQRAVDSTQMPSIADKVAMFSRIVDTLCSGSYQWVGLDCFARSGDTLAEAQRQGTLHRNWIGYTDKPGRRVLGLGSSSVSDLSTISVHNHSTIEDWQRSLERGELPVREGEVLSKEQRAQRHALSDLMCNLESTDMQPLFGADINEALQSLAEEGLLQLGGDRVSVTQNGRFMLHRLWGDSAPSHRWEYLA